MTQRMHQAAGLDFSHASTHAIREMAMNINSMTVAQRLNFAIEIIRMTRRLEQANREASDNAHQANVLHAELVKLRQQLNETLAAGGALPSAPPAGPSAGGGD